MTSENQDTFCHLRARTDYSFGWGVSKVKEIVARAKSNGQPAMALVDNGNLHGALEFSSKATSAGIQPILGARITADVDGVVGSFSLIVRNQKGFDTLREAVRASSDPNDGPWGTMSSGGFSRLLSDTEGLFLLVGSGGEPADSLLCSALAGKGGYDGALGMARRMHEAFGSGMLMEICRNGEETQAEVDAEAAVLRIAQTLCIPIVATTEAYHARPEQAGTYALSRAITQVSEKKDVKLAAAGTDIVPPDRKRRDLRGTQEMRELFSDLPEAFENASAVARMCAFHATNKDPILPPFETETGASEEDQLREKSTAGLRARLDKLGSSRVADVDVYEARLDFELGVIIRMKFPGYFLIVADFIGWAKSQHIPVGPGRGSGAGSVVAWALGITDLDPLRWGLLFERFLNPDRVSMPDFDVDFCQDRRGEVIDYVRRKYGPDKVATISTFTGTRGRSALQGAARVLMPNGEKYRFSEVRAMTELVHPKAEGLQDAYDKDDTLRTKVAENERMRLLFNAGLQIEGANKGSSSHAAGIVIGDRPISEIVPAGYDVKTGHLAAQYSMSDVEKAGLVKFDFLGLKNMTIIQKAVLDIGRIYGEHIDLHEIPFDDQRTLDLFAEARTDGIFQFASGGMKSALRDVRPKRFEDLIAVVALYRPGPMANIPFYADCNNGRDTPVYPDPVDRTKEFLSETYGIMVYQEQVMQVAQTVAGYTLGQADLLRRAMGKKKPEEMAKEKGKFIDGAVRQGGDAKEAERLFALIEKFASYGFNKSHAAAYALISWWTGWFKANYPAAFYAATMSYEKDTYRERAFREMRREFGESMRLLPVDVNVSVDKFVPERRPDGGYDVRFGFCGIKGMKNAAELEAERARGGPFKSVADFAARTERIMANDARKLLAVIGALEELPYEAGTGDAVRNAKATNRTVVEAIFDKIVSSKKSQSWDTSLFADITPAISIPSSILALEEKATVDMAEKTILGFHIRKHPLDRILKELERGGQVKRLRSVQEWMVKTGHAEVPGVRVVGIPQRLFKRVGKESGKPYLVFDLVEKDHIQDVRVFDGAWAVERMDPFFRRLNECIDQHAIVATVDITYSDRDGTPNFSVYMRKFERAAAIAKVNEATLDHVLMVDAFRYAMLPSCPKRLRDARKSITDRLDRDGWSPTLAQEADDIALDGDLCSSVVATISEAMRVDEVERSTEGGKLTIVLTADDQGTGLSRIVTLEDRPYAFGNGWTTTRSLPFAIDAIVQGESSIMMRRAKPGDALGLTSGDTLDVLVPGSSRRAA